MTLIVPTSGLASQDVAIEKVRVTMAGNTHGPASRHGYSLGGGVALQVAL